MSDIREFPMPDAEMRHELDTIFAVRPNRVNFAGILMETAEREPGAAEPEPRCSCCNEYTWMHYDTSGCFWIGCMGALKRKELGLTEENGKARTYLWGDQHPAVSVTVRRVLATACGPLTATFNDLSSDQQTEFARQIAKHAVEAHLREETAGNR